MIENDERLQGFFEKYPHLKQQYVAVQQFRRGEPISVTCLTCGETLVGEETSAEIWITCPNGCVRYRLYKNDAS